MYLRLGRVKRNPSSLYTNTEALWYEEQSTIAQAGCEWQDERKLSMRTLTSVNATVENPDVHPLLHKEMPD